MIRETNLFPHVYHPGDSLRGHGGETVLVARRAADLEDHAVALGLRAQVAAAAAALRGGKSHSNLIILFVGKLCNSFSPVRLRRDRGDLRRLRGLRSGGCPSSRPSTMVGIYRDENKSSD